MDQQSETVALPAWDVARRFLQRWRDVGTRSWADDIAQDAAIELWRQRATLRRPDRSSAFLRTVSRRRRFHLLAAERRRPECRLDADPLLCDQVERVRPVRASVRIAGYDVAYDWCLAHLRAELSRLEPLNERIVRSYYEGFSCSELAERYGLSEQTVKVRLHRSRGRIRREIEGLVRAARAAGGSGFDQL